jgi:uncharacterized protein
VGPAAQIQARRSVVDPDPGALRRPERESLLGLPPEDEDRIMEEAAKFVPACVTAIAAYWRGKGPKQISMALMGGTPPYYASSKVGRNHPCPCGSGKKFKKCCGKAA